MGKKSACVAYLLWLIGGVVGLHLFYLGRDRHAFVWWATLGGVFGLGWLRDAVRIGEYVDDANGDLQYMEVLVVKMKNMKRPPFNSIRFCGELCLGWLFAGITAAAIPSDWLADYKALHFIVPLGSAVGVWLVGGIGREQVSFAVAALGAYCAFPFYLKNNSELTYMALFPSILVNWKGKSWRRLHRKPKHCCTRLLILTLCAALYLSLWGSAFYHNAYVTTADGQKVRVKEAVKNFFNSQAWIDMKRTAWDMFDYYQKHGWDKMYEELIVALDPEGEAHAYRVLDLPSTATDEEVTKAYRTMAKKWHPDKTKDPAQKEEAATKFMEIQKAYETLSQIKNRRKKSRRSEEF